MHLATGNGGQAGPIKLHGLQAIAHLECEPGGLVERHVFGNLANDGREFSGRHMRVPLLFVHIP